MLAQLWLCINRALARRQEFREKAKARILEEEWGERGNASDEQQ